MASGVTLRLQPGLVRCPPDCGWEAHARRPSSWNNECPQRWCAAPGTKGGRCEPIEQAVKKTLDVVWRHLPEAPARPLSTPRLLLVTTTFPHKLQLLKLSHCATVLRAVRNVLWIVSEDASQPSAAVSALLAASSIPHRHLATRTSMEASDVYSMRHTTFIIDLARKITNTTANHPASS